MQSQFNINLDINELFKDFCQFRIFTLILIVTLTASILLFNKLKKKGEDTTQQPTTKTTNKTIVFVIGKNNTINTNNKN